MNIEECINKFRQLLIFTNDEFEICPWVKELTLDRILDELKSEIVEVQQAKSAEELSSELGDLLRDVILTIFVSIRDNNARQFDEIVELTLKKIRTRKPFVVNKTKVTKKEAIEIWNNAKRIESNK